MCLLQYTFIISYITFIYIVYFIIVDLCIYLVTPCIPLQITDPIHAPLLLPQVSRRRPKLPGCGLKEGHAAQLHRGKGPAWSPLRK